MFTQGLATIIIILYFRWAQGVNTSLIVRGLSKHSYQNKNLKKNSMQICTENVYKSVALFKLLYSVSVSFPDRYWPTYLPFNLHTIFHFHYNYFVILDLLAPWHFSQNTNIMIPGSIATIWMNETKLRFILSHADICSQKTISRICLTSLEWHW